MNKEPDLKFIIESLRKIGVTQAKMAASIGCSQPTISHILTGYSGGKRPWAKVSNGLVALAKKHRVPLARPAE